MPEEKDLKDGSLNEGASADGVGETVSVGMFSKLSWLKLVGLGLVVLAVGVLTLVVVKGRGKESTETPSTVGTPTSSITIPEAVPTTVPLYPCHSAPDAPLEKISGYDVIDLYAVKTHSEGYGYDRLETPPTISLTEFKDASWPAYDVYYEVAKDTQLYRGFWGVSVEIEVCDENNMTNVPLLDPSEANVIPESQPAASTARYVHGGYIPAQPGTYRVDAYFLQDGKWHLTHRLEDLVFTE